MKLIRFKRDWRYSREGQVIEEGDGVALLLIQRGIAEEVKSEGVTPEEAATDENADAAHNLPPIIVRRVPGPNEATAAVPVGRRRRG